jgi:RHS repeat-associated protein
MTGSDGELLWGASYTAFGQARVHLAKESQPWRLSGQYCDEETGLCYMMARFCNPELGRFLTPDPWGVKGGSLNFYSYCDGDPLNKIDPTGDFVFLVIAAAVVIGAAVGAGVEAYKQHKQHPDQPLDWGEIGKEAAIGAAVGAVAAGVGLLLAPVGTAVAAGIGGLGGAMVGGGLVGGAVGGVQQCASNALHHAPLLQGVGTAMGVGAAIGTVTAGVGSLWANRAASAAEEADPALLQRYLTESGGRWGGTQTRLLNHQLASNLEDEGFTITGGAGRASEEWIPGPGGGTKGGTFVDITATNGENTIRVQTVSTLTDGVTPTPAEAAAAERINAAFPNDELRLVPKK